MINQLYSQIARRQLADGGVANILVLCRWSWRGSVEVPVVGILKYWNTEILNSVGGCLVAHETRTSPLCILYRLIHSTRFYNCSKKKSYFTRFTIVWKSLMSLHLVNISPTHPLNHVLQCPHQTAVLTDPLFWQFITLSPRLFCSSVLVVSLAMRFNFLRPWFNILPALKVSTGIQQVMTWWRALIPNQAISWCSNRCQPVAPIVGSIALCSWTKLTTACLVSLPAVTVSIPHQSSMSPPA